MAGNNNFGYKLVLALSLMVVIANVAARDFEDPFIFDEPQEDSTSNKKKKDTINLQFPIQDNTGVPTNDAPRSIDLKDPSNIEQEVEYSPEDSGYYFSEKLSDRYLDAPTFMTFEEYLKYQSKKDGKLLCLRTTLYGKALAF